MFSNCGYMENKMELDMCTFELDSQRESEPSILVMYPKNLQGNSVLEKNIDKMIRVIRKYIAERIAYQSCIDFIPLLPWESQKISMQNIADAHQHKADILAEKMDEGISPYACSYMIITLIGF